MADDTQNGTANIDLEAEINRLSAADEAAQAEEDAKAKEAAQAFDTVERKNADLPENIAPETDGGTEDANASPEDSAPEKTTKDKKTGGGSSSILLYILLGVLVLAIAAGVLMVVKMLQGAGTADPSGSAAPVNTPRSNITNNANFIYMPAPDEGSLVILEKYVADRLATVFHFAAALPEGSVLTLTDDQGRPYFCDTRRTGGKLAYFPPLASDTRRFTLTITDADGALLAAFDLREHTLNTPAVFLGADAVTSPEGAEDAPQSTVRLAGAQLSSSGTTIWLLADSAMLPGADTITDMARLEENLGVVLKTGAPLVIPFAEAGMSLIRFDFAALQSLHSKLRLTVRDTAVYLPVEQTLTMDEIFTNGKARDVAVDLGTHTVVLEGLLARPDGYTLVMHTEDNAIAFNPDKLSANRTEGVPDVSLLLQADGETIEIKGLVQSKKEGADVRFELGEYADAFAAADTADITLRVDTVRVKQGDTVMNFDLAASAAARAANEDARNAVEAYYAGMNIVSKTGYEVSAPNTAEVDGTVYALVREDWTEDGAAVTRERLTIGTVSKGVYTATTDEALE